MTAAAVPYATSPSVGATDGWESYPAGAIMRCPGFNTDTRHQCRTGMGEVGTGRRAFLRVKPGSQDHRTDTVRRCRRCGCDIEIRFERPTG